MFVLPSRWVTASILSFRVTLMAMVLRWALLLTLCPVSRNVSFVVVSTSISSMSRTPSVLFPPWGSARPSVTRTPSLA